MRLGQLLCQHADHAGADLGRFLGEAGHDVERLVKLIERVEFGILPGFGIQSRSKLTPGLDGSTADGFLIVKVMEKAAFGKTCLSTDLIHAGRGEPLLEDELNGRTHNPLPGFGRVALMALGFKFWHTNRLVCKFIHIVGR